MIRFPLACGCMLALALAVSTAAAQSSTTVYKWKDARGVTHYTDAPPPRGKATTVTTPATPGASRSAAATATAKADTRCSMARTNIERLKSATADVGIDKDGDGKPDAVLDAAARARQLGVAEDQARRFCAPAK